MAVDAGKVALNPRGAYSSTTTYERLDVVTYQSNTYVALQTTLGNLPTDTSSWMALVKVDNASMSVRGLVKVDGTSITADADGTIHGHAAAGVNSFNGRDGDVLPEYGDYDAEQIAYDNTDSGLTSNRSQGAIDELTPKKIITSDDAFDPTKTYAVGDWLIYQGVLYEVITACTGITPPNATYYNPITLHELKNRIDTLNSELEEQKALVKEYSVTLSGSVGTSNTFVSGTLELPPGLYMVYVNIGANATVKSCGVAISQNTNDTLLANQNSNSVAGFIKLTYTRTLYVYAAATNSASLVVDSRFTYLKAVRVA